MIAIASFLFVTSRDTRSQAPDADGRRFEVGGQFSLLNISTFRNRPTTNVPCLVYPCPGDSILDRSREAEPGFGGRIGYNITNSFAVEAEVNFFPSEHRFNVGREIQGLFGLKAGHRFEKVGVFGKIRPGFLSSRTSEFRARRDVACITIFPPPATCFDETVRRATNLAVDIGGVVELYPSKRTVLRFDVGDTIIRFGQRSFIAPSTTVTGGVIVAVPADTTHNLQGSIGIGFRF